MKRLLSHIILLALLVISPVSFSTSKIPNFYVLVTVNAPLQESRKTAITVANRVAKVITFKTAALHPDQSIAPLQTLAAIYCYHTTLHGRAPPVVHAA